MIVHECPQHSDEWYALRCGIPTSSAFDRIVTGTLKPSSQAQEGGSYYRELLSEWAMGRPLHRATTDYMRRGTELEGQARIAYRFEFGTPKPREVGFITDDAGTYGCSPDGLVEDGGLEIKTPKPDTHVLYMLEPEKLVKAYAHQVQGTLFITGAPWWDIVSFHTGDEALPLVRVRCEPDTLWQLALSREVPAFLKRLDAGRAKLREMGVGR